MAIQLNAQRGGFSINGGYLLVTHARVDKYLRPVTVQKQVTQDDGTIITVDEPGMVNAVMTVARIQVYPPDPPPASHDAPLSKSWREGPDDLDVADIISRWWRQMR